MLKITTPYGYLKFRPDIEIPITITNPLFNDRGSYSLPFSVPEKPNREALGFPASVSSKTAVGEFIDCVIEHGLFKEKGTLKITDVLSDVELTLTTREGAFWEWAKKTKLSEINFPESDPFVGTVKQKNQQWMQRIKDGHAKKWPEEYFNAFPVVVQILKDKENEHVWGSEVSDFRFLNKIDIQTGDIFWDEDIQWMNGVSPFIYLNALLSLICQTYGYRLINELENDDALNRTCIINNATRAIVDGVLNWKQLVPNIPIVEVINILESKIGAIFYVDTSKKLISIKLADSIITSNNTIPLKGTLVLKQTDPVQIKLKSDTFSGDYGKVIKYDDQYLLDYALGYEDSIPVLDKEILAETNIDQGDNNVKIIRCKACESYFFRRWVFVEGENFPYKLTHKFLGNRLRDYDPETSLESKEFQAKMIIPPMISAFIKNPEEGYASPLIVVPCFDVPLKDYEVNEDFENFSYNDKIDFPFNLCIYRGKYKLDDLSGFDFYFPWGSSFTYDRLGNPLTNLPESQDMLNQDSFTLLNKGNSIENEGFYDKFWKNVEQHFLISAKQIEILNLSAKELLKYELYNKFNVNGTNFLFEEIKLTLKAHNIEFDSATGYTLKPFT